MSEMKKLFLRVILIFMILLFASIACINSGDGDSAGNNNSVSSALESTVTGPQATATYGAQQFHLQLTAVAQPGP